MDYKNIKILHEDKDLIVLNKPHGLSVHPGAGKEDTTLVSFLFFAAMTLMTPHNSVL